MPTAPPGRPHQYRKRTFHEEDEESDDFLWWNKMITGSGLTISNKSTEYNRILFWVHKYTSLSISITRVGHAGTLDRGKNQLNTN
ncbi:hypothetical protein LXL04_004427 [Taraxacum kok-saghyz]